LFIASGNAFFRFLSEFFSISPLRAVSATIFFDSISSNTANPAAQTRGLA
jgi:hypothetical protein